MLLLPLLVTFNPTLKHVNGNPTHLMKRKPIFVHSNEAILQCPQQQQQIQDQTTETNNENNKKTHVDNFVNSSTCSGESNNETSPSNTCAFEDEMYFCCGTVMPEILLSSPPPPLPPSKPHNRRTQSAAWGGRSDLSGATVGSLRATGGGREWTATAEEERRPTPARLSPAIMGSEIVGDVGRGRENGYCWNMEWLRVRRNVVGESHLSQNQ